MPVQMRAFSLVEGDHPGKTVVTIPDKFQTMMNHLIDQPVLAFDWETSGTEYYKHARPCGIALGYMDGDRVLSWYVPYRHQTGEQQLDERVVVPAVKRLLENPSTMKAAHNIKFDDHMARTEGIHVQGPRYDTMVAARLYDENRSAALKYRAASDLGHENATTMEKALDQEVWRLAKANKLGKKAYLSQYGYAQTPVDLCGVYACYDIDFTLCLRELYERWGLTRHYPRIVPTEMALTEVLCDMEENGMPVDVPYLEALAVSVNGAAKGLESRIHHAAGKVFKVNSDRELRAYLRDHLGLRWAQRTKNDQWAVDREVLTELAVQAPVCNLILEYRDATKLATTYTTSILDRLDADNFLHGDFQQVGTDTGRLSCRSPNFQNFPSDNNDRAIQNSGKSLEDGGVDPWSIRRAFINRGPGWVRLFFDYSQIELRVLAYYTRDPIMVEAYLAGEDIHTRTSLEVFGTAEKARRRQAKVINFGLCIAEGQEVLTRQDGLVPIECVEDWHDVWDGVEWVGHEGLICRGEQEVITYDGLTATPDHEVYLQEGGRVSLWELASQVCFGRIAIGARGEVPVGYAYANGPGWYAREQAEEPRSGAEVRGLRKGALGVGVQYSGMAHEELHLPARQVQGSSRQNLGPAVRRNDPALPARYARIVKALQGAGCQSALRVAGGFYYLGARTLAGYRFQGARYRPDRQRRSLLPRQFAAGYQVREHPQRPKVAKVYDLLNAGPRRRFTVAGKIVSNSYCMSAAGFARQTKMPYEEAEKYLAKFFERYHGIETYRKAFWMRTLLDGCQFNNIWGRTRRIPALRSTTEWEAARAKRQAIGSLIQGTAAELTKESLVRVHRRLKAEGIPALLVSTIHDEIQLDVPVEYLTRVAPMVKQLMEDYPEFAPIPIVVDGDYSTTSWADKKSLPL